MAAASTTALGAAKARAILTGRGDLALRLSHDSHTEGRPNGKGEKERFHVNNLQLFADHATVRFAQYGQLDGVRQRRARVDRWSLNARAHHTRVWFSALSRFFVNPVTCLFQSYDDFFVITVNQPNQHNFSER